MNYKPIGVAAVVGVVDGIINPAGDTAHVIPHGHLLWRAAAFGAGLYGKEWGHWDPNVAVGLMVSSAALIASRIPAALSGGGFAALGDQVHTAGDTPAALATAAPSGASGAGSAGCSACGGGAHADVVAHAPRLARAHNRGMATSVSG